MKKKQNQILVADDDPVYREVATAALEEAGYHVTIACDGGDALRALKSTPFDIAIVDLTMPVADGVTVIENARLEGPNAHTPIIVITGHDDAAAVENAYKAGATSFLTKPLNWLLFTPHVEFVLRSGQIESELRAATAAAAFLSDLKSQMMSALAREFQAPIKTIFGFSELIRKQAYGPLSPPMYADMALDMGRGAQSLNTSLLKLMDYGRTLTDQLEIKDEPVAICDLMETSLSALALKAERRGVVVNARIDLPPGTTLTADPALLSQAVRGLIDNAIRLAPRDSTVDVIADISDNGAFRIRTTDQGPPVSAELLAEVNASRSARPSVLSQSESRDVGIKIAKILTEAHQGRLDIRSDAEGGNQVRLEIPKERLIGRDTKPKVGTPASTSASLERLAAISDALANDPRVRLNRPVERQTTSLGRPHGPQPDIDPQATSTYSLGKQVR